MYPEECAVLVLIGLIGLFVASYVFEAVDPFVVKAKDGIVNKAHRRENYYYSELLKIEPPADEVAKIMHRSHPKTYARSLKENTVHLLVCDCSEEQAKEIWRREEAKRLTTRYYDKKMR